MPIGRRGGLVRSRYLLSGGRLKTSVLTGRLLARYVLLRFSAERERAPEEDTGCAPDLPSGQWASLPPREREHNIWETRFHSLSS